MPSFKQTNKQTKLWCQGHTNKQKNPERVRRIDLRPPGHFFKTWGLFLWHVLVSCWPSVVYMAQTPWRGRVREHTQGLRGCLTMHSVRPTIQSILGCRRSSKVGGRGLKKDSAKKRLWRPSEHIDWSWCNPILHLESPCCCPLSLPCSGGPLWRWPPHLPHLLQGELAIARQEQPSTNDNSSHPLYVKWNVCAYMVFSQRKVPSVWARVHPHSLRWSRQPS